MNQLTLTTHKISVKIFVKILIVVIIAGLAFFGLAYFINSANRQAVIINNKKILVDIIKTEAEMARGLGGRKNLPENRGLLFAYDGYYVPKFWMKDMLFSIDIIWIKDNMVTGFEKNVPLSNQEFPPVYQPKDFVNYVLEVNAGLVDKNQIKIGDRVDFKK